MKKAGKYDHYTASDLARETRARGLEKPDVLNISEWAVWLEAQDAQSVGEPVSAEEAATLPQAEVEVAMNYDSLTVAQLKEEAERRQIDTSRLRLKSELIDALQASDGMTESQQAALDGAEGGEG